MEIKELRRQIDELDDQVLEWVNRRAALALEIGKAKRLTGEPIRVPQREEEVVRRLCARSNGPLSSEAVVRIFTRVIEECRGLEESDPS